MNLKIETVRDTLNDFGKAYAIPTHINGVEMLEDVIWIYHRELSKHYSDEKFRAKGATIAWTKTRKFPAVSDFFEGFDGNNTAQTAEELLKGYK